MKQRIQLNVICRLKREDSVRWGCTYSFHPQKEIPRQRGIPPCQKHNQQSQKTEVSPGCDTTNLCCVDLTQPRGHRLPSPMQLLQPTHDVLAERVQLASVSSGDVGCEGEVRVQHRHLLKWGRLLGPLQRLAEVGIGAESKGQQRWQRCFVRDGSDLLPVGCSLPMPHLLAWQLRN